MVDIVFVGSLFMKDDARFDDEWFILSMQQMCQEPSFLYKHIIHGKKY